MAHLTAIDLACLRGARLVFEGVNFSLEPGGALLLTGPNGSGKSSLLRMLAGLLTPFDGALAGFGDLTTAYIGHLDPVKPTLTVAEMLSFWARLSAVDAVDPARINTAMATLDLTDLAQTPGRILSSGQRRRLSLARLPVSGAALWLLDEPTVGLDRDSVAATERLVADHRAAGGMVVLSTHIDFALPDAATLDMSGFTPAAFRREVMA